MNIDIEQRLRESADTVAMNRPVDDILTRGDRLRRRRTRGMMAGVGAAAAMTALAASLVLPPSSSPLLTPAVASWSGGPTNLSAEELEAITDACLKGEDAPIDDDFPRSGSIPEDTLPLAAESREGTVLAFFRHGDAEASCVAKRTADGAIGSAGLLVDEDTTTLPAGTDLDRHIGFGYSDPGEFGGPMKDLWTIGEVSSRVERVTANVGGESFEGAIVDGVALFWVSEAFTPEQVDNAVFTAYDSTGLVLARVGKMTRANDPQGPNDDSHM